MDIKGWVYEDADQGEYSARYKELVDKGVLLDIEGISNGYAHKIYSGFVADDKGEKLSVLDIGLLYDKGNLCFGGSGYLDSDGKFRFKVHTD